MLCCAIQELSAQCGHAARAADALLEALLEQLKALQRRLRHLDASRAALAAVLSAPVCSLL